MRRTCSVLFLCLLLTGLNVPPGTAEGTDSPTPPAVASEEAQASAEAARSGVPVEIEGETTPTQRILANPDGSFVAELSAVPARVKDHEGNWTPIDTTLQRRADGSIAPGATLSPVQFSGGGTEPLVELSGEHGETMALDWAGPLPEPRLEGSTATYPEVFPAVDLAVKATGTGFSTYFVVKTAAAAQDVRLRELTLDLKSDDVAVSERVDGTLVAADAHGDPVFTTQPATMWDARGVSSADESSTEELVNQSGDGREAAVDVSLSDTGDVVITPDRSLLTQQGVDYPVVIDPAWTAHSQGDSAWAMVWSNGTSFLNASGEHARVGYDGWSGQNKKSRSFFRFDLPAKLDDAKVDSAQFSHLQTHSPNWTCKDASFGPAVHIYRTNNFSSSPDWPGPSLLTHLNGGNGDAYGAGHEDACGAVEREWTVTLGVQSAINENDPNVVFGLKSADETDKNGWRKYDNTASFPALLVYYNHAPTVAEAPSVSGSNVANPAPSEAVWTNENNPEFVALVDDQNDNLVDVCFSVNNASGTRVRGPLCNNNVGTANSAWSSSTSVRVSALPEATYRAYVTVTDTAGATVTSPLRTFTVDKTGPGDLAKLEPMPPPTGWIHDGAAGSLVLDGPSDVEKYVYTLNGAEPTCLVGTSKNTTAGAPQTVSITPSTAGLNTIRAVGCDKVNNQSVVAISEPFEAKSQAELHSWQWDGTSETPAGVDTLAAAGDASYTLDDVGAPAASRSEGVFPVTADPSGSDKAIALSGVATEYQHAATDAAVLDGLNTFTVSAWVKVDAGFTASKGVIASQAGTNSSSVELAVEGSTWVFRVRSSDSSSAATAVASLSFADATCGLGEWCFIAGTWNGQSKTARVRVIKWAALSDVLASPIKTTTIAPYLAGGPFLVGAERVKTPTTWVTVAHLAGVVDRVRVHAGAINENTDLVTIARQ